MFKRISQYGIGSICLALSSTALILVLSVSFPSVSQVHGGSANGFSILATADTEGHVGPCRECPLHPRLGSLARRATVLAKMRKEHPEVLLVDSGNFLIGTESLESQGRVIIGAYDSLGYDAANLSHHDFWLGKEKTMNLLTEARFSVISANLLDEKTAKPLANPYVVKKIGGQKLALIGVTHIPAGLDYLPHLKERLAGIRIEPPVDALAKWLPKAKAEADRVVLLYHGSAANLQPIRDKFGPQLSAILVAGIRPEQLPEGANPPLIGTSNHGRHLAQVTIPEMNGAKWNVTQIAVEPTIQPNAEMEKLLAKFYSSPGR
jgi:2',3'-cyclic-nucleotide 2'-phosphodiesterase (5'-nucleotidase family)